MKTKKNKVTWTPWKAGHCASNRKACCRGINKMKKPKLKAHLWTIRINDGWSEYEYRLPATNGNASIYDIYEMVRKKLKAKKCDGKYIPATSIPR